MKDTLIEMKNNLRGINTRGDKLRMKSPIWNIRKQKHPIRTNRKKNLNERIA